MNQSNVDHNNLCDVQSVIFLFSPQNCGFFATPVCYKMSTAYLKSVPAEIYNNF